MGCTGHGFDSCQGQENALYFTAFKPALWPTLSLIQWVQAALSSQGRGVNHPPPSSAEIKKLWSYTSFKPNDLIFFLRQVMLFLNMPNYVAEARGKQNADQPRHHSYYHNKMAAYCPQYNEVCVLISEVKQCSRLLSRIYPVRILD
jgi:hypothetical protein